MQMTSNSITVFNATILKNYAIVWSVVLCAKNWMNENRLMQNDNKTEGLLTNRRFIDRQCGVSEKVGTIGDCEINNYFK